MKIILYPEKENWDKLTRRPEIDKSHLEKTVKEIIDRVRSDKDKGLAYFSGKLDGIIPVSLKVTENEFLESVHLVPGDLKKAIDTAKTNIQKFHSGQLLPEKVVETSAGVRCWRKNLPIEKVGLYVPGGSAPLFSTLLMLGVPAKLAGCKEIVVCTPPGSDGKVNPLILYTARLIGIDKVFKAGGAQAIAAMAFGTESIPGVHKIFGPGNQYVTKAKELVQRDGIAIDMPAGPSEVLIIADNSANPEFIAADLLSQAEHGPDSQVIMVTNNKEIMEKVGAQLDMQAGLLPRKDIALRALENSKMILLHTLIDCVEFSNQYAPEHLIVNTSDTKMIENNIVNAGSVFIGSYSCESAGDYASGTNHTLPTNGYARSYSGVSAESFIKKISFQEISAEGIINLGPAIELLAEAECLNGHRNAVSVRLNSLRNGRNI